LVNVVEVRDLRIYFPLKKGVLGGVRGWVRAVDGVDLAIPEASVVSLVGESGSGKTTLGKAVAGLVKPTSGKVLWRGRDVWSLSKEEFSLFRRKVQYMPQDPYSAFNPSKTVFDHLCIPLMRWGRARDRLECVEEVARILESVKVTPPEEYMFRYPHQLSGGERQRILFARIMMVEPELVVTDEPVSAIDVALRIDQMNLMLEFLERQRVSYLFISHELASARYMAERGRGTIAVMYLGRIVEQGPPRDIIEDPLHPYTKALIDATPELDPRLARSKRLSLRSIDIPKPYEVTKGCRFANRCPKPMPRCFEEEPPLINLGKRLVRCWRCYKR